MVIRMEERTKENLTRVGVGSGGGGGSQLTPLDDCARKPKAAGSPVSATSNTRTNESKRERRARPVAFPVPLSSRASAGWCISHLCDAVRITTRFPLHSSG